MIKKTLFCVLICLASTASFAGQPDWVSNPTISYSVAGMGMANIKTRSSLGQARLEAIQQARVELTSLLESHIDSIIQSALSVDDAGGSRSAYQEFSNHVTYMSLGMSRPVDMWIDADENIYVLVALDERLAKKRMQQALTNDLKSLDEQMWEKFNTKKVKERLENEMNSMFQTTCTDGS